MRNRGTDTAKRIALGLGAALLISAAYSPAGATMITFQSTVDVTDNGSSKVSYSSAGLNTSLPVGGLPTTITDFITVTVTDGEIQPETATVTADFTFTMPTPFGTTTDTGSIVGFMKNGNGQLPADGLLTITWPSQPVEFDFTDGTKLDVTLGDLIITGTCPNDSNNCLVGTYDMSGTFDVQGTVGAGGGEGTGTSVPEPATISLFALGIFGLGMRFRRRRIAEV